MTSHVQPIDAESFIPTLADDSVDLFLLDPPYYKVVKSKWDHAWATPEAYVEWLVGLYVLAKPKLKAHGSLLSFAGLGEHDCHPVFDVVRELEKHYVFRNWITWKKRRAYGKSHDYLYCREEILWFSKSSERTEVTFNVPLLDEKRGYEGFDKRHPAKSEFKRVSNVWTDIIDDIPELMRPEREAQKPPALMERLVSTHSNPGDLVVDFFSGYGSTGIAAHKLGRRFLGCERIEEDALKADELVTIALL